jgi:hypothetical protein
LIPVTQAAREYKVSERTLYRALRDGRLSRFKGGLGDRKVYVDRREVKRLLQPRKVKS